MMKKIQKIAALLMALLMLLTCAAAEDVPTDAPTGAPEETADDTVYTFNGQDVLWSEIQDCAEWLYENSYADSADDYASAIEYLQYTAVMDAKIVEWKLNVYSQEEEDAFRQEAQTIWDEAVQNYVENYMSGADASEEEISTLRQAAAEHFESQGATVETLTDSLRSTSNVDKLDAYMREHYDIQATDEEVQELFDSYVERYRQMYENKVLEYEYMTKQYGYDSWYRPAGYRAVLQILLEVDSDLLDDYQNKLTAYEEGQNTDEDADAADDASEKVTEADVEAARQAVIASRQTKIDDIYARLANGESIETLIAEYNADPGMSGDTLKTGYLIHKDSIGWDTAFQEAAFDERMQKPGDMSAPAVGIYGIYMVYYLADVPDGAVEMTDDIRTSIVQYIENTKMDEQFSRWIDETEAVYNEEALSRLAGLKVVDGQLVDVE